MAGIGHAEVPSKTERNFRQKTGFCDVTFQIGEDKIYASKAVLGIASPVFCEMFRDANSDVITLTDVVAEDFIVFLKYIYPDQEADLNATTVYLFLPFAHKYKVGNLWEKCANMLLKIVREQYSKNATQLYRHVKLSDLYNMEDLRKRCVGYASECLLSDLDEAQKVHSILPDTHLLIQRTALRKLERFKKRTETCSNYIDKDHLGKYLSDMLKEQHYRTYSYESSRYKPEDKEDNFMQTLCIVFEYLNDNRYLKQRALKAVKSVYKNSEIFDLLPEDLKYEIENLN